MQNQDDNYIGTLLSEIITSELASEVTLLERQSIDTILYEQKIQTSEIVDLTTAVALGKLLGANYIMMASFQKKASEIVIYSHLNQK